MTPAFTPNGTVAIKINGAIKIIPEILKALDTCDLRKVALNYALICQVALKTCFLFCQWSFWDHSLKSTGITWPRKTSINEVFI